VSLSPDWFKPKTIKLVFVAKYAALRRKSINLLHLQKKTIAPQDLLSGNVVGSKPQIIPTFVLT
jgi:hypothetical protein